MDVTYVDVPHEPTLSHSTGPSTRVMLPLEANPGQSRIIGALLVLGGLVTTILALFCMWVLVTVALGASFGASQIGVMLLFFILLGLFGNIALLIWTRLADRLRPRPMVTIGLDGIRDRRISADLIPWNTMERATLHYPAKHFTLTLQLRSGFAPRHWPFRPGVAMPWQLKANEVDISFAFLRPGAHVLSHVVRAVAEKSGVKIVPPEPPSLWGEIRNCILLFVLQFVTNR